MATAAELAQRITLDLRIARHDIMDLPMHEADWPTMPMHTRITLLYEWQDTLSRIEWLTRHHRNGDMSDEQTESYREMLAALRESVPILERLEWPVPPSAMEQAV